MRVLVTGGAGFIGSHLVDRLMADGHQVMVIDNLATGRRSNIQAHMNDSSRFSFYQQDVADYASILPIVEKAEWVFHLAALADIVPSIQNPLAYHHANVEGTVSILEASRRAGVKRFVYTASSSCYGIPDTYPTPETAAIRPQYPYAVTKYLGEKYVMYWHQIYGLPVTSLRFFNVYGPRSRTSGTYGAVFGVFLAQKLNHKPFTVVGDGTQTRDFTFVTDVVNACIKAAATPAAVGEIMNVGSGNTYSVNRLVELLEGDVAYIPKRPGEPDCTFADITKIRSLVPWKPTVRFEEGVRTMLSKMEDWKDAPLWEPASISRATEDWFRYLKEK